MNKTKPLGGMLGIVLGMLIAVSQTGCELPGMRGGPPGLPGLPGPPRVKLANPSSTPVATALPVESEKAVNSI